MEYHFKFHKAKKGYWGYCLEIEGVTSQGETMDDTRYNFAEALNLALDEPADSELLLSLPNNAIKGKNIIKIKADSQIALAMLVRQARVQNKLTQAKVAAQMKIPLYSYQRLENSKTANPEWKTLVKLKKVFPDLHFELAA